MSIIAPLLPQLGVTDVMRSLAFYRDVLAFDVNWEHRDGGDLAVAELQLGPAKLQIAAHDGTRDDAEQRSARRATVMFLQTDDVDALHAAILQRGGRPSNIEPVYYWMRMRLFSINDPDDHELWFGQRIE
jgi:predicted enzyme related to lactoylglutathione lyase